jgi:predicted secreted protein
MSFSASDLVWLNDTAYQTIRTAFDSGILVVCQIVYPGSGYYQGNFVVTELDEQAPFDKEITSSLTLESSQAPVWTTGAPA